MDVFSKSQCRDGESHYQQNLHTDSAGLKLRHVVLAALLMVGAPVAASQEERQHTTIPLLSDTERNKLESLLTVELQRVADQKKHFEEQKSRINVNVRLDAITEKLVIDIGAEYGPLAIGGEAEDFQSLLHNEASLLLEKSILLKGIEFRYGGKDFYHYFPTEWQPPRPGAALKRADKAARDSTIVVAAGHSVYYHHGFGDW